MSERDLIDELLQAKVKSQLFGGDHAPRVGRLVILDSLGSGGMGTVFSAYDPRLDRKVAVKLLRGEKATAAQVLREARMLGKLNHPNVVAVYDATESDGVICIVMELAPGDPLRAWVGANRPWQDVVGVMQQVAEGLAAEHRAGIVHRDVKPDNVVIGADRVRLVDFGLASGSSEAAADGAGTPAYMAPEVLGGAAATPASDQFSFGVTLFEALYGARPHRGDSHRELREAAGRADAAPPPRERDVPSWLHRVATKALASDPSGRFESMDAVSHELGRDRRRKRRMLAVGAAVALVGSAAVAYGYHRGATRGVCEDGRARVAAAFPASRIDQMRQGLGDAPWAVKAIDDFARLTRAWEGSHRRVCEATRVQGGQSEWLMELRMRCLDRRFDRMSALGAALAQPLSPDARASVSGAVAELPRPERCETLLDDSELSLPQGSELRERVKRAEHELDRAWAEYALGRYREAREVAAALERDTSDIGFAPFRAALLLLLGSIEARLGSAEQAQRRLDAALLEAAAAHAASMEVEVWVRLLRNELFGGNLGQVVEWVPFARAAAARAGNGGAEIDGIEAEARRDSGELVAARSLLRRALTKTEELRGDQRALLEMNLGSVELAAGHPLAAEKAFSRAYALAEGALGKEHPGLGLYLDKMATAARERGRIAFALQHHQHALELRRRGYGEDDRAVATTLLRRAQTQVEAGKLAEAEQALVRARAIRVRIHGGDHRRLGEIDWVAAELAAARGDATKADELRQRALKLDPRLDAASGAELSVAGAKARAALVARLVRAGDAVRASDEASRLWSDWSQQKSDVAPALSNAVASAERSVGERARAARAHEAALAALSDEPSLERFRALEGLSECTQGERARDAARAALRLLDAMPEVDGSLRARLVTIADR